MFVALFMCCTAARSPAADSTAPVLLVTSPKGEGPGTLRAAIVAANAARSGAVTIRLRLPRPAVIVVARELPALAARGLTIEGGGATVRSAPVCVRPDGRAGCSGLVVNGPAVTILDLTLTGFLFDGIAVRGVRATDTLIRDCRLIGNLDDGVGISAYASNVRVENCVLAKNGFRTKGKGILVFDSASAILRNNLIQGNRDGVTVSRGARATLENNLILHNYDKGLGVSGATVQGFGNRIVGSGAYQPGHGAGPNADGLRVGLTSLVVLRDTVISSSVDNGVVVLDNSRVVLRGGEVSDNGGVGFVAADDAELRLVGVRAAGNRGGERMVQGANANILDSGAPPLH